MPLEQLYNCTPSNISCYVLQQQCENIIILATAASLLEYLQIIVITASSGTTTRGSGTAGHCFGSILYSPPPPFSSLEGIVVSHAQALALGSPKTAKMQHRGLARVTGMLAGRAGPTESDYAKV